MELKNREEIQPLRDISAGTMELLPFDACAEFVAKSAEEFMNFMKEVYGSSHLIGNCNINICFAGDHSQATGSASATWRKATRSNAAMTILSWAPLLLALGGQTVFSLMTQGSARPPTNPMNLEDSGILASEN
jgi:hypothetical protein